MAKPGCSVDRGTTPEGVEQALNLVYLSRSPSNAAPSVVFQTTHRVGSYYAPTIPAYFWQPSCSSLTGRLISFVAVSGW